MFETEDPGKFRVHMGEEVVFIDDDGTDEVYDGPGIMILGHDDKSIRIITARTEKRADRMLVLRGELHELSRFIYKDSREYFDHFPQELRDRIGLELSG